MFSICLYDMMSFILGNRQRKFFHQICATKFFFLKIYLHCQLKAVLLMIYKKLVISLIHYPTKKDN